MEIFRSSRAALCGTLLFVAAAPSFATAQF